MVPMQVKKRKGALHEPHEFRVRAPIESGEGPPYSKTLARWPQSLELPPGFGVRRRCGTLDFPGRFMVAIHGTKVVGALQEPRSSGRESTRSSLAKFELTHVGCYEPEPVHGPN